MKSLPRIMVAPNGARLGKHDHAALPVTINEISSCARDCHVAGAGAIHAHVRDEEQNHVLDSGLYRELIAEVAHQAPGMDVQITTEAAGKYSPEQQRKLVREVRPAAVSVSLAEMFSDHDNTAAIGFYQWASAAGIAVQHILYDTDEFSHFIKLAKLSEIPSRSHQILFVLGRYSKTGDSRPDELEPFLQTMNAEASALDLDWAVCAFGQHQLQCLIEAMKRGGKARVGFENGLWLGNGYVARDNADLVDDLVRQIAFQASHKPS